MDEPHLPRLGREPMRAPRLAAQAVFVDWHGVLSDDPFWSSILTNGNHWLHVRLRAEVERLFTLRRELVGAWMRGHATAAEIIATIEPVRDRRCADGYLLRRLWEDCFQMRLRSSLLDVLQRVPPLTAVVIATDNMDCFADNAGRRRGLARHFYGMLCSSDIGVLKAEDPQLFFGAFVESHGLDPARTLLIDDGEHNCAAFEGWGGSALHFRGRENDLRELERWSEAMA